MDHVIVLVLAALATVIVAGLAVLNIWTRR